MSEPLTSPAAAAGTPWPFESAVTGLVEVTDGPIDFTPVPRLRRRRDGWTPEAQHAFMEVLAECGCIARAVGRTARTVKRPRKKVPHRVTLATLSPAPERSDADAKRRRSCVKRARNARPATAAGGSIDVMSDYSA